jgi:hypothetical protein
VKINVGQRCATKAAWRRHGEEHRPTGLHFEVVTEESTALDQHTRDWVGRMTGIVAELGRYDVDKALCRESGVVVVKERRDPHHIIGLDVHLEKHLPPRHRFKGGESSSGSINSINITHIVDRSICNLQPASSFSTGYQQSVESKAKENSPIDPLIRKRISLAKQVKPSLAAKADLSRVRLSPFSSSHFQVNFPTGTKQDKTKTRPPLLFHQ